MHRSSAHQAPCRISTGVTLGRCLAPIARGYRAPATGAFHFQHALDVGCRSGPGLCGAGWALCSSISSKRHRSTAALTPAAAARCAPDTSGRCSTTRGNIADAGAITVTCTAAAACRHRRRHGVYPRRHGGSEPLITPHAAAAASPPSPSPEDSPSSSSPSSSSAFPSTSSPSGRHVVEEPSTALLLAWFACGNRSLFAAQCLVEALLELYREGRSFGELQLSLKMATQAGRPGRNHPDAAGASAGDAAAPGPAAGAITASEGDLRVTAPPLLLQSQDEDVLVSWVALVFLTLEELGVPRDKVLLSHQQGQQQQQQQRQPQDWRQAGEGMGIGGIGGVSSRGGSPGGPGSGMAAGSAYLRGMLGYVRQTLGLYDEGQTLARVAGLQGLVQQSSSSAASSPSLALMQHYSRLVLLTLEVVVAAGLPTSRPLLPGPTSTNTNTDTTPRAIIIQRLSGYAEAFSGACNLLPAADWNLGPEPVLASGGGSSTRSASFGIQAGVDAGEEGGGEAASATAGAAAAAAMGVSATGTLDTAAAAAAADGAARDPGGCPPRGLAVRLLMAFMGAVLGSPWSMGKFVEAVRVAYDQGLAADELFSQLDEQEFVQSGGLLPLAPVPGSSTATTTTPAMATGSGAADAAAALSTPGQNPASADTAATDVPAPLLAPQYQITKALLSTWISLSYMALAQLGVPYPAAEERLGWAWAGFGSAVEAIGMNEFVGNVLRQMAGADPRGIPQPPQPPLPPSQQQRQLQEEEEEDTSAAMTAPTGTVSGGDPNDGSASAGPSQQQQLLLRRRRGDMPLVRLEDESLPASSTAVRVLTQQVMLVQAVCRHVAAERRS